MDFVLVTGDQAIFDAVFAPAIVVAPPGTITGTGRATINGSLICVEGDEASVLVPGAVYTTPTFPIPGVGLLRIVGLGVDQVARKDTSGRRGVLLKGSQFRAQMQVMAPASNPTSADAVPIYNGTGTFLTTNVKVRAA